MGVRRIGTLKLQCNNFHVCLFLGYLIIIAGIITFPYFLTRKTPPGYIIGGDTLVHAAIARGIYLGRNPLFGPNIQHISKLVPIFVSYCDSKCSRGNRNVN
jgi:hypothetical protein